MMIDPNSWGHTKPIQNIAEQCGIPLDHAFVIADYMLHDRENQPWIKHAEDWGRANSLLMFNFIICVDEYYMENRREDYDKKEVISIGHF